MKRREFMKISALTAVAMSGGGLFGANLGTQSNPQAGALSNFSQNAYGNSEAKIATTAKQVPNLTLNNGVNMPILGLGVWKIPDLKECQRVVEDAFSVGYRLVDTAQAYHNEEAVGAAFRASGLKREEVFIESKISPSAISEEGVLRTFDESLKKLKLDYADLFLLHNYAGDYNGAWRALTKLYKEGRVRAIGISNFYGSVLKDIASSEVVPMINQVETHPYLQHFAVQKELEGYGIKMQAWSQFGNGINGVLKEPILAKIGEKYNKTAAQVILRWLVDRGVSVIPKTTRKERLIENISIFDFELSKEDFAQIATLERNERLFGGWGREDI